MKVARSAINPFNQPALCGLFNAIFWRKHEKKYTLLDISELMDEVFHPVRTPRSVEYMRGVRVTLQHRLMGTPIPALPYSIGSCEADAYFSGQDEGREIVGRLSKQEAHRERNRA